MVSSAYVPIKEILLVVTFIVCLCFSSRAQHKTDSFLALLERAEAASDAKRWNEAGALWSQVIETNPVNGMYYAQLGNACYNTGKYEKAIAAYKKQYELGYGLLENVAYNIACNYALAREKKQALDWLEKAFDLGYKSYTHPLTDADLVSIRQEPRFIRVLAVADVAKMNRTEGWVHDLQLLEKEVQRKAFRSSPALQFDNVLKRIDSLKKKIPQLNDTEVVLELMRLMVLVGDGHSGILPPAHFTAFKYALPMQFYLFKEGLYIISADPKYKALLGSEVVEFGGSKIKDIQSALEPLIPRDNMMGIPTRFPYLMRNLAVLKTLKLIPDDTRVNLKLKDLTGKVRTVSVVPDTTQPVIWNKLPNPPGWINFPQTLKEPVPLYLKSMNQKYWFEYLKEKKVVYCQINSLTNDRKEPLPKFYDRLFMFLNDNEVDRLVVDLRWNNGGNTFLAWPFINALVRLDKINRKGNLFVITGRRTYSAAQNLATFLERYTNATFVGEPTGSSPNFVGEEDFLLMPYSKVLVNVSDLFWQSSWPSDKRTWIAPTLFTPPAFEYFKVNRDPAMEAILELGNTVHENK